MNLKCWIWCQDLNEKKIATRDLFRLKFPHRISTSFKTNITHYTQKTKLYRTENTVLCLKNEIMNI